MLFPSIILFFILGVLLIFSSILLDTPASRPNDDGKLHISIITKEFREFLISEKDNPESNFTMVFIAKKRGGKTSGAFSDVIDPMMQADPRRLLCLYCDPPLLFTLLTNPHESWEYFIDKYGLRSYNPPTWEQRKADETSFITWLDNYVVEPSTRKLLTSYDIPTWSDRVYIANEPSQIKPKSLLFIDDMKRLFSAKSALRKDVKSFGESITITSHQAVCIIGCIQDNQMTKDFRRAIDMVIHKSLTPEYIKDCEDPYIASNASKFVSLRVGLGYLHSTYSSANYNFVKDGIIEFTQLSWFTMEHSLNASQTSFDSEKDRLDRIIRETKPVAEEILQHYGNWALKPKMDRAIKWFITLNHGDRMNYFLQNYDYIISMVIYELTEKKMQAKREKRDGVPAGCQGGASEAPADGTGSFGDFIREHLGTAGTNFWKEKKVSPENEHEILALYVDGMKQAAIAKRLKMRVERVNQIWAYYWGHDQGKLEEYAPVEFQTWKLYELYEATRVGGTAGGETGVPDTFYPDGTFGECKIHYDTRDERIPYSKMHDFGPSVDYATKAKQAYFHVSIRNIAWIPKIKNRPIDFRGTIPLEGPDKIVVDREKGFMTGVGRDLQPIPIIDEEKRVTNDIIETVRDMLSQAQAREGSKFESINVADLGNVFSLEDFEKLKKRENNE